MKPASPEPRKRITIRMGVEELQRIDIRAKAAGLSRSEYMRQTALEFALQTNEVDIQAVLDLQNIGADLHHLRRIATQTGSIPKKLPALLEAIEEVVMKVVIPALDPETQYKR